MDLARYMLRIKRIMETTQTCVEIHSDDFGGLWFADEMMMCLRVTRMSYGYGSIKRWSCVKVSTRPRIDEVLIELDIIALGFETDDGTREEYDSCQRW
jgi:hypothetical protein